jgi:hypothetical protein
MLEDLLLAERRFEAEGEDRLARLAAHVIARILQQVFGDLLRDRRSALGTAPANARLYR